MKLPAEITFEQELDQLELRIARRADELARLHPHFAGNLAAWEQAEREIWSACLREIEAGLPRIITATPLPARAARRRRRNLTESCLTPVATLVAAGASD